MRSKSSLAACAAALALVHGCGAARGKPAERVGRDPGGASEAWNPVNDPLRLDGRYVRAFSSLPLEGALGKAPWSDSYWPTNEGGIAARWNQPGSAPFTYEPPSESRVRSMGEDEISRLSPAEKYDIYRGRFDYPTVRRERQRVSPSAEDWEGLCHGWASVAYLYDEPRPVTLRGANGVSIPFGSSDVKALLTYVQGEVAPGASRSLGARCNVDLRNANPNDPACKDVNAGAFHVVLSNQIGLQRRSFIADVTRDRQVWNQPVHGFRTRVVREQAPSPGAAPGTAREVVVQTRMVYTIEVNPAWRSLSGTSGHADDARQYDYRLELDRAGNVVGGEWLGQERPDFLWVQSEPSFTGHFDQVDDIWRASVGGPVTPQPTPRPTVAPQPTPRPTVAPQPTPRPTVAPQPTVAPIGRLGPIECPEGYRLEPVGSSGGTYCSDGSNAWGPFTDAMVNDCLSGGGGPSCDSMRWNRTYFLSLRGTGICPRGADYDATTRYCREGSNLFGPFPYALVQKCVSAGGGEACYSARWSRDFYISLTR